VRLTRNPQEAEDLVQDTLLRAYRFFDRYQPGSNFKAWLFKILKNSFINRYRKAQREANTVDFGAIEDGLERLVEVNFRADRSGWSDPEQLFMKGVVDSEIQSALEHLPPEYRMVLILAVIEEMSYKEIAAVLECPIGTVMSRLHRARRLMQTRLLGYARRRGLVSPPEDGAVNDQGRVIDIGRFRQKTK
jgi:RNA polymerase sigma-70 factor (ECF subfamily)